MAVTIRGKTLPLPILQGGMGVGISLDGLAGAVAACGGMGTLSTAVCGFQEPDFAKRPFEANLRALDRQVRHAKVLAHGTGLIAVNAMVATTQYADSVRTALRAGADAIVCGAGLPKDLPALASEVSDSDAAIAPHRQQRPGGGAAVQAVGPALWPHPRLFDLRGAGGRGASGLLPAGSGRAPLPFRPFAGGPDRHRPLPGQGGPGHSGIRGRRREKRRRHGPLHEGRAPPGRSSPPGSSRRRSATPPRATSSGS